MSRIIGNGRYDKSMHRIEYRAAEKSLFLPFSLSEEELKRLEEELGQNYKTEKDFLGIKIVLTSYESISIYKKRFDKEEVLVIDGFIHGCTTEKLKEFTKNFVRNVLIREKLRQYWNVTEEEAQKRIEEINKSFF